MIASLTIAAAGLALGIAGSAHCAVMCGPLVLLSQPRDTAGARATAHISAYHGGRLLMYGALGAIAGGAGGLIAGVGFGRGLAAAAAVALLVQAFWQWRGRTTPSWPALTRAIGAAGRWMRRHTFAGPAAFGALTGLLPCGLIYAALTAAIGIGGATNGALFMVGFAAGSVPVLAAIGGASKVLPRGYLARGLRQLAPAGLVIVALLLVFRAAGWHGGHGSPAARFETSAPYGHHHH
jgi:sulfite exporter TauE/SafE